MKILENFIDIALFIAVGVMILGMIFTDYMPSKILIIFFLVSLFVNKLAKLLDEDV